MVRFHLLGVVLACIGGLPAQNPLPEPQSRPAPQAQRKRQGGYLGLFLTEEPGKRRRGIVRVESVFPGSQAEKLGFKKGDIMLEVNGRRVRNGDAFLKLLWSQALALQARRGKRARKQESNEILVQRGKKQVTIQAGMRELDKHPAVGDEAPLFRAKVLGEKKEIDVRTLLGKKPLVLIFGSFT